MVCIMRMVDKGVYPSSCNEERWRSRPAVALNGRTTRACWLPPTRVAPRYLRMRLWPGCCGFGIFRRWLILYMHHACCLHESCMPQNIVSRNKLQRGITTWPKFLVVSNKWIAKKYRSFLYNIDAERELVWNVSVYIVTCLHDIPFRSAWSLIKKPI
jgi:hypothetical protein